MSPRRRHSLSCIALICATTLLTGFLLLVLFVPRFGSIWTHYDHPLTGMRRGLMDVSGFAAEGLWPTLAAFSLLTAAALVWRIRVLRSDPPRRLRVRRVLALAVLFSVLGANIHVLLGWLFWFLGRAPQVRWSGSYQSDLWIFGYVPASPVRDGFVLNTMLYGTLLAMITGSIAFMFTWHRWSRVARTVPVLRIPRWLSNSMQRVRSSLSVGRRAEPHVVGPLRG